jgi:hypothetical protein
MVKQERCSPSLSRSAFNGGGLDALRWEPEQMKAAQF